MAEVLTDSRLREGLLVAGRRRAATFSWDRCAAEVEAAFADALGTGVAVKEG
jgi:glycosyltransferase involved in cell wall biosynthesis